MATIYIKKGYADGKLDLSDSGYTEAIKNELIEWQVQDGSNVDSIVSIELKKDITNVNVFSEAPKPNENKLNENNWNATISPTAPDYTKCHYSIGWKGKEKSDVPGSYIYDPIISIKPTP